MWCPECREPAKWVRDFHWPNIALALLTLGAGALFLPLYKWRCRTCGLEWSKAVPQLSLFSMIIKR